MQVLIESQLTFNFAPTAPLRCAVLAATKHHLKPAPVLSGKRTGPWTY